MSQDGRDVYIHGNVRLLRDENGQLQGALGSFFDVTSMVLANEKIAILSRQSVTSFGFEQLVGNSEPMREVFRQLKIAADSDVTVYITGESGTGKELAARAIHAQSDRKHKPFLAISCSAIPEPLLESELFGHVKGSFTGAVADKLGMFETANEGTLFLDEIGDGDSSAQWTDREAEEWTKIVEALRQTGGNRTKAAELLGTSRVTLWKKIGKYSIEVDS